MSWTYFTSYLTGDRPITQDERDELFDQFNAKLAACDPSYFLEVASLAEVKASLALTDIVKGVGPGGTTSPQAFAASLGGWCLFDTPPPFGNYSSALTAALSDEGISGTDLADMVAGSVDSYHYWNFLKRLIDYLACIPTITQTCRSKSATKTKCGFAAPDGSNSKRYRTETYSGTIYGYVFHVGCASCEQRHRMTYTGAATYATPACSFSSDTRSLEQADSDIDDCTTESGGSSSGSISDLSTAKAWPVSTDERGVGLGPTSEIVTGLLYCVGSEWMDGSCRRDVSDEYTTADLAGDVDTALAAASFGSYGSCVDAIYTRTSDELTIAKRAVDVKETFSASLPGPMALSYDIYNRTGGVLVSNNCVNLSAGATEYVISLGAPPNPGDAYYVTNVVLTPGTC